MTPPLYRAIDPNALDELFGSTVASAENGLRISFTYSGYEVTVVGTGNVVVRPADDAERDS
ncbi:HalOD1 output domain-containing protein [Halorussus caseinilyticus]|uniref:HalOD1 output domain-containing protein n=1 Tax=Halorussus caseinilyticus TaxID=3034025 RepID=A0ABD5WJ36_9EURY